MSFILLSGPPPPESRWNFWLVENLEKRSLTSWSIHVTSGLTPVASRTDSLKRAIAEATIESYLRIQVYFWEADPFLSRYNSLLFTYRFRANFAKMFFRPFKAILPTGNYTIRTKGQAGYKVNAFLGGRILAWTLFLTESAWPGAKWPRLQALVGTFIFKHLSAQSYLMEVII